MARSEKDLLIGQNIKAQRKSCKLTQEQLATAIGKTVSSVQKYESGDTEVPRSVLELISGVLDCHILDLLDFGSGWKWYSERDGAIISFLESIGYELKWSTNLDFVTICYKGTSHKLKAIDFLELLSEMEYSAIETVSNFNKKNCIS